MSQNLADGLCADRAPGTIGAARRRRDRRLRAFLKHERLAVAMNMATIQHHSHMKSAVVDVCVQVGSPLAPVTVYAAPAPAVTYAAPAPVVGYVSPAPAVSYTAPAPVVGYVAPAPAVTHAAPAPVFEYVAPAPVSEYIAPAPAVSFVAPSQQLRPACAATVATGVNLDVTGMVYPHFSSTAVVGSASQVVGSLPHGEVFAAPVFNQVHQEQLAGDEIPENLVEIPVVPEQVIPLRVVGPLPPADEFTVSVYSPVHQQQFSAGDTTENIADFPVVQEQVLVQDIPRLVGSSPPVDEFTAFVARRPLPLVEVQPSARAQRHIVEDLGQVIAGLRPERLVDARGPHGGLERVRHSAVEPPIPGCVVLVQEPEAHDNTTTRYLLKKALQRKEEEEEAEKEEEVDELLAIPLGLRTPAQRARLYELISASSQARRRKRKKRRKRKTPKSSSFRSSSGVRPRRCGQGSRSRSSSSGGCGRLREHVRQVPAVADLQWKVPPSISSTKWWTFQLCYGDRYGCLQVQFLDHVVFPARYCATTGPLGPHSADICAGSAVAVSSMVVDIPVFAQLLLPMVLPVQKTIETPQLQSVRWSMPLLCRSCHARCRSDRCSWFRHCRKLWRCRSCSSSIFFLYQVVDISVVVQRQFPMVLFRTIEILQLQYTDKVIDVPVVPVLFPSAGVEKTAKLPRSSWTRWLTCPCVQRQVPMSQSTRLGRRCVHAATSSRQCREVPQSCSSTRCSSSEEGDFAAFCAIFRTPSAWT